MGVCGAVLWSYRRGLFGHCRFR